MRCICVFDKETHYKDYVAACERIAAQDVNKPVGECSPLPTRAAQVAATAAAAAAATATTTTAAATGGSGSGNGCTVAAAPGPNKRLRNDDEDENDMSGCVDDHQEGA